MAPPTGEGLLTARTEAERRAVGMSRRLAAEGLGEQGFGQYRAEGDEQFLDVGELGAPGGPVGPVELIDEVFGNALEIRPRIFDLRGALFGCKYSVNRFTALAS